MATGRFSKWTRVEVNEPIWLGKRGLRVEVWTKWKKKDKKLGTLQITVAGLRWLPKAGKKQIARRWEQVRHWFEEA